MPALTQALRPFNKRLVVFAGTGGAALLILAAIATPNLLRSRMAANEATAASRERIYASAQQEKRALSDTGSASMATGSVSAEEDAPTPAAEEAATIDRKLVRTGALALTVTSPAASAEQIRRMAEGLGGYLESEQIGGTKDAPTADLTIRVPAARFEDARTAIRKVAARVESESTNATDVTRQYVDMQARLRNLRAEEAQYLTIMKSAFKVDDLLQVTEKLSEVRGQIEQQQAEFQTLSKQVETVAISISLHTLVDTQVFGLNWRPLYQLKVALHNGLEAIADYAATMATILFYIPVILAWSLTILCAAIAGWRLLRWTGRRFFAWPPAPVQKAAESA
jgi:hypothetical protein